MLISDFLYAQHQAKDSIIKKSKPDSIQFHPLEEIVVSGKRISFRNNSATPVQVLSGRELQNINSMSVADAIRYFSGVQLKDYGGVGGLKTINVRSMGTNHSAVFYDGIQLGNAQNGQVDLGKFSLENLEEISLYNGQKSSIFQPVKGFASGSSLYLTTKFPAFDSVERDHAAVSFKTGSFGLLNPALNWSHKITQKLSGTLSAEWLQANGRYKFRYTNGVYDTVATRSNSDIEAYRLEAGINGIEKDSSGWNARIYYYNSERGLPGAVVSNKFDYTQRQWDRNFFVQTSYKKNLNRYSFLLNAKYGNDYTRYTDPEYITTSGYLDNRYKQQEFYLSMANRYTISSWWNIAFSADYQWNKLDADIYRFAYPKRNTVLTALASEWKFKRFDLQANILGTFVNDKTETYTAAGNKEAFTPAVLFSWQPFAVSNLRIRGFYKKIFRLPTFNDLYYTYIGNVNLNPEYATQYDLGISYTKSFNSPVIKYLLAQADGYYNHVKDKIVAIPGSNLFRWTMYNLGKVSITGLDLNMQAGWQITRQINLSTSIAYTWQQALDVTGGDNYGHQIPYIPVNSGSFIANAQWNAFSLNYSFIYTGERYSQKTNIQASHLEPWYTHDISAGYELKVKSDTLKLIAEVNNLANQYYDVISNFPMPGRSFRIIIRYNI